MITVYTTETCANCLMAKRYLSAKNVEYEVIDITHDDRKKNELYKKTGLSMVPIITNGKDFVVGFQPKLLQNLIG